MTIERIFCGVCGHSTDAALFDHLREAHWCHQGEHWAAPRHTENRMSQKMIGSLPVTEEAKAGISGHVPRRGFPSLHRHRKQA